MYLKKLELQGFKSFANKITLCFFEQSPNVKGITAIVGPNGSGKSNLADAVRWTLGEQSLKLLRGKKSEDVIFSGSGRKARSGFAEVSLYLDNIRTNTADTQTNTDYIFPQESSFSRGESELDTFLVSPLNYSEIVLMRRIYRSGESEYLLNKKRVRLQDILLMLAGANFGQRTYSVIGQGMIESFLLQSPKERKEFFDEAAGIKQFQIKRQSALHKLETTEENLKQAEILLHEIKPRLRSLTRQINKLEKREEIKKELHEFEAFYYGILRQNIERNYQIKTQEIKKLEQELAVGRGEAQKAETDLMSFGSAPTHSENLLKFQKEYEALLEEKNKLREKEFNLKQKLNSLEGQKREKRSLPLDDVIREIEEISHGQEKVLSMVLNVSFDELSQIQTELRNLSKKTLDLLARFKEPDKTRLRTDKSLLNDLSDIASKIDEINSGIARIQDKIKNLSKKEEESRKDFFAAQKRFQDKQQKLASLEHLAGEARIALACLLTRREALFEEIKKELRERADSFLKTPPRSINHISTGTDTDEIYPKIMNLRSQLEIIGGIDPETLKEYQETKKRHDFLEEQHRDLKNAFHSLREIIKELDTKITRVFNESFYKINEEFEKYFKKLFGGGRAKLLLIQNRESDLSADSQATDPEDQQTNNELDRSLSLLQGIEIQACPPGKKIKGIGMLSGGERALTSIALICAIISTNPSPFVVLDEVDAALDESNSIRFAEILDELSHKTQFIVITHNRATMQKANALYGVTMSDEGISRLLSLKLEDIDQPE